MKEHASAAASGIPTPTPMATSLDEQLGHEAVGMLPLVWPFAPPAEVAEHVPLAATIVVVIGIVVVTVVVTRLPVTAAPVTRDVTVESVAVP